MLHRTGLNEYPHVDSSCMKGFSAAGDWHLELYTRYMHIKFGALLLSL